MTVRCAGCWAGTVLWLSASAASGGGAQTSPRAAAAGRLAVATGGRPVAAIVTPDDPPYPVRFAAEELKHFLDRMTGAAFRIVHRVPRDGSAIVLGEDLAGAVDIGVSDLVRDGYRIKTVGPHVYVAGRDDRTDKPKVLAVVRAGPLPGRPNQLDRYRTWGDTSWDFERGTLHGVYDLLERFGVRWFLPGPRGTVVPRHSDLCLDALDVRQEPHFLLRVDGRVLFPHPRYIKLGVIDLTEYRDVGWSGNAQRLWMVRMRTSSAWMAFNHRPARHQWARRFAKDHPEYFALLKTGQRAVGPKREYLCYTHPGVVRETLLDMEAYFAGKRPESRGIQSVAKFADNRGWHPNASYGKTFSLLPNDGLQVDRSPASRAYLHEDKPLGHRHTEYVWQFVAKVAREADKRFPGKLITCVAYQAYGEVPPSMRGLPDNVIVGLAPLSSYGRIQNVVNPTRYQEYMDLIRRWHRMNKQPMFYWSYWLYRYKNAAAQGVPMLLPRHAGRLIKDLARYGRWMFMQHDSRDIVMEHINRYVVYRLLWNPNANVDAILNDYVASFYGPARQGMGRLLRDVESRCETIAGKGLDHIGIWEKVFTGEVMTGYRQTIDDAVRLTHGTPHARAVRLMDTYFVRKMEQARAQYVAHAQKVRQTDGDLLRVPRSRGLIVVDGTLSDKGWRRAARAGLCSNVDGKRTRWPTRLRVTRDRDTLYCAFECRDPEARQRPNQTRLMDYVEVFLDPDGDRYSYYWIKVDISGALDDHLYPGAGEPPDPGWDSRAKAAVKVLDDRWNVEIAIPLGPFAPERAKAGTRPWAANFCRTMSVFPRPQDRFSSFSPLLRGSFHQPGLFARMAFED